MSDIITELRERSLRAEQEGDPIALLDDAAAEIARLRLTDAERRAVEFAWCSVGRDDGFNERDAGEIRETLEQLLERTK